MIRLDLPDLSPAENLAADEVLLDVCERGDRDETIVFWEPRETFVVVGYANKVAVEVNVSACEGQGIPIFRRCSGGGTVAQLPGGLNYSLMLRITETGPTRNITTANQYIMAKNRAALETLFPNAQRPTSNAPISVRGHTDLCLGDLKFAGNAQRRRKEFLLFHGTFLLNCDLARIGEMLRMPSLQPDYRADRPHEAFVTNLNQSVDVVKTALAREWGAAEDYGTLPLDKIKELAREKYSTGAWNFKF